MRTDPSAMVLTTSAQQDLPAAAGLWVRTAKALPVHPETGCPISPILSLSGSAAATRHRRFRYDRSIRSWKGGFGRDSRQAGADTAA